MIARLGLYESVGFDPWENLAVEEYLLSALPADQAVLYLWQNQDTVVIGRNQSARKECRLELLEAEGGRLARRLSGGGAVWHDLGNLNFTLLLPQADFDPARQTAMIVSALASLGLPAESSGRNDVLVEGRKVSGCAYYKNGLQAYHHGTLLLDADLTRLARYLSPPAAKLRARGVDSVRARVGNLREFAPALTVQDLKQALVAAFGQTYGHPVQPLPPVDPARIAPLRERYASAGWRLGPLEDLSAQIEGRLDWGTFQLALELQGDRILRARLSTDAMDWDLPARVETCLAECPLSELPARLAPVAPGMAELILSSL